MFPLLDPLQPTALPALFFLLWLPLFLGLGTGQARIFFIVASSVTLVFVAGPPLAIGLGLIILGGYFVVEGLARLRTGRTVAFLLALALLHAGYWACFQLLVPGGYALLPAPQAPAVYILFSGVGLTFLRLLSYTHERVRLHAPALRLTDYLAYMLFFPQFRHGPIERPQAFAPRLAAARQQWSAHDLQLGLLRAAWGFAVLLAMRYTFRHAVLGPHKNHPLGWLAQIAAQPEQLSLPGLLLLLHLPALALYAMESSAAHIQLGVARVFGVHGSENCRFPFLATNPHEVWQRWSITLSTWLRDYAYLPLGLTTRRRLLCVAATFVYAGLLHGLQWRCLVWGLYTGLTLAAYAGVRELVRRRRIGTTIFAHNRPLRVGGSVLARLLTMHWACIGVTIFLDPEYCGYRILRHYVLTLGRCLWP